MKIFSSFNCGDLLLLYFQDENIMDIGLIPASMQDKIVLEGKDSESMIQFRLSGTPFGDETAYTLRNSPCVSELKFLSQGQLDHKVITRFQYGTGLFFDHIAELHDGWIRVWTEVNNQTAVIQKFDLLDSFSLGMVSPFENGSYYLERVTERWHHEEISMERAGMERSNSLRFGTNGSMPVAQYYPFAGIEDRTNGVLWGAQLENSGAWMLEFGSSGKGMALSGGIPDRMFCGSSISVSSGGVYHTPSAILTCVKGNILDLFNRLQRSQRSKKLPDVSPVYQGTFSTQTLRFLKTAGIRYYVLDHTLNTEEIEQIAGAGLIPGVTMDIETLPQTANAAGILTQDGTPLQVTGRYFMDYRDSEYRRAAVQNLCSNLQKNKIGYVKFICPASFCGGCDGTASQMENQQQYTDSVFDFYAELKQLMPELVIEISTNGIGRFSAKWLSLADVMTTMDNLSAVSLTMTALDWQMLTPGYKSGVHVSLNSGDDLVWKLNTSLLGRLILSGDLTGLLESEKQILLQFLDFYNSVFPVLQNGSYQLGHIIGDSCTNPTGWQVFYKTIQDKQMIVFHLFSGNDKVISLDLLPDMEKTLVFPGDAGTWHIQGKKLEFEPVASLVTVAILFEKK